jgi:hypothetical protein
MDRSNGIFLSTLAPSTDSESLRTDSQGPSHFAFNFRTSEAVSSAPSRHSSPLIACQVGRSMGVMPRLCTFLVFLLLILTFNAYACILPLQTAAQMDCSSSAQSQEDSRQICDAFLIIGPQSEHSPNHFPSGTHIDLLIPGLLPDVLQTTFRPSPTVRRHDHSIHPSIPTTVLRI